MLAQCGLDSCEPALSRRGEQVMRRPGVCERGQKEAREKRERQQKEPGGRSRGAEGRSGGATRTAQDGAGRQAEDNQETGRAERTGRRQETEGSAETDDRMCGKHEFRSGAIGAETASSGPSERSQVPTRQGLSVGSYRFQTPPCLHWEAAQRTFAKMNYRHRMSS